MHSETRILNNCISLLEQAIGLIEQIDDDVYISTSPISPRGSIGGHLRHIERRDRQGTTSDWKRDWGTAERSH